MRTLNGIGRQDGMVWKTGGTENSKRKTEEHMGETRVALVTGAGRGIGKETALALAASGCLVIVNYSKSKTGAEETVCQIRELGGQAEAMCADVSDEAACRTMTEEIIAKYGRLDILVNNAGITADQLLLRMSDETFDAVVNINLKGTFHAMRSAARYMIKQRWGRIISISSVSGVIGNAGQANYAAAKAGVIGLSKSAARELAGRGITVNVVAPGYIDTAMTSVLSEEIREKAAERIPMKRMGTPKEAAAAVAFLASEAASYITGQVLCVDGGMAM